MGPTSHLSMIYRLSPGSHKRQAGDVVLTDALWDFGLIYITYFSGVYKLCMRLI